MDSLLLVLSKIAVLAVAAVLIAGLWTMLKGSSPSFSQTLMRWRVGLQFVAIVVLVAFAMLSRHA